jgi:hypothetical protein
MILCPNCHHQEVAGALFCSECGARLVLSDEATTQFLRKVSTELRTFPSKAKDPTGGISQQTGPVDEIVSLSVVDNGLIIHLAGQTEFTLGRSAEAQPILPDVDLSAFEAYSQGVSRLHAVLKILQERVVISDLGSSNGTRVNGQKIAPHVDFPLNNGDIIALGKLKLQVIIRR